jgi:hypothetical protein
MADEEVLGGAVVCDVINNLFFFCFIGLEASCFALRGGGGEQSALL